MGIQRDRCGFVDKGNSNYIGTDRACGNIFICACTHNIVQTAYQISQWNVGRMVLDLDQADHICVNSDQGAYDLVPLAGEFVRLIRICAATALILQWATSVIQWVAT